MLYKDGGFNEKLGVYIYPTGWKQFNLGLTYVLIINYGTVIKGISALMYTVWHVDKYKITFKLVISNWTNESWSLTFATQMLCRRSGSELFDTFKNIILLRIFPL